MENNDLIFIFSLLMIAGSSFTAGMIIGGRAARKDLNDLQNKYENYKEHSMAEFDKLSKYMSEELRILGNQIKKHNIF